MPIQWNDSYSVNVKEIDEQHKKFIEILNQMYDFIYAQKDKLEIRKILDQLTEYANLHFKTEEGYFDKFNYENSVEHKEEHKKLKNQVVDFYKKIESGQVEISLELLNFLENWLVDHLEIQDQKYVKCFNDHGLF